MPTQYPFITDTAGGYSFDYTFQLGVGYQTNSGSPLFVESHVWEITAAPAALDITDDDEVFDNDTVANENGDDSNQTAIFSGSSEIVYVDVVFDVLGSDGVTYTIAGIDVRSTVIPANDGIWYAILDSTSGTPPAVGTEMTFVPGSVLTNDTLTFPCFDGETQIDTPGGMRQVRDLAVGDLVHTLDHDAQAVRWIGRKRFSKANLKANPKLYPVRITAGALGLGLPKEDLLVSRQHRVLIDSKIAERMFGDPLTLVAAIRLTDLPGVFIDETVDTVEYCHIILDQHAVVFANGAASETLYLGEFALDTFDESTKEEIYAIFPEFARGDHPFPTGYNIPSRKNQKNLIARHVKNGKLCLAPAYDQKLLCRERYLRDMPH